MTGARTATAPQRHHVLHPTDGTAVLVLAYPTNPIPANGPRHSFRAHAARVRAVRETAAWLGALAIPHARRPLPHIDVHLTWYVTTNRRRDADNLVPTMKALVDGLTTSGVIADDHDGIVTRHMPTIQPAPTGAAAGWMELAIRTAGAGA